MIILSAKSLVKTVATKAQPIAILKGVSLAVNKGEAIAILGASGSGKTTLLSLLAGLDTPTEGEIELNGQALHLLNENQRAAARLGKIGFIFQNFELLPFLSVLENVMLPLMLNNQQSAKILASDWLDQVGLNDRKDHFPNTLSGGEQQRVAIARAFAMQPEILFADEPTGSLDSDTGDKIINLLFSLRQQANTTLILVTHDVQLAKRTDAQYLLTHGQLTPVGETA